MTDIKLVAIPILLLAVSGCGTGANRLVTYPETDVLFTTPAEVDRLCKLAPNALHDARYAGCYFPHVRLAIVPHGDEDVLAHELRHAHEGNFHEETDKVAPPTYRAPLTPDEQGKRGR